MAPWAGDAGAPPASPSLRQRLLGALRGQAANGAILFVTRIVTTRASAEARKGDWTQHPCSITPAPTILQRSNEVFADASTSQSRSWDEPENSEGWIVSEIHVAQRHVIPEIRQLGVDAN